MLKFINSLRVKPFRVALSMMLMFILTLSCIMFFPQTSDAANSRNTIVGAIRWDGWVDPGVCTITVEEQRTLSGLPQYCWPDYGAALDYEKYMPFFATGSGSTLNLNGANQTTVNTELTYAKEAGLNYFAYCYYSLIPSIAGGCTGMVAPMCYHTSAPSSLNESVKLCAILGVGFMDDPANNNYTDSDWLSYWMTQSCYQTVSIGGQNRPLVFFMYYSGTFNNNLNALNRIRSALSNQGKPAPYVVMLDADSSHISAVGAEATSRYACSVSGSYADLCNQYVNSWSDPYNVVPCAGTGWDARPRDFVHNPDYAFCPNEGGYADLNSYTPGAIGAHIQSALDYCRDNISKTPANCILMNSWNEFSETGSKAICPKRLLSGGVDRSVLDEVKSVLVGGVTTNYIQNPGFESGGVATQTPPNWSTWCQPGTSHYDADQTESANPPQHGGTFHLIHWKSSQYNVYLKQP